MCQCCVLAPATTQVLGANFNFVTHLLENNIEFRFWVRAHTESHLTLSFNNFQYECRLFDVVLYQCNMSTNAHQLQPFFPNYKCFEREINSIFQLLHFIYHSLLLQNRNLTEFYIVSHIRSHTHGHRHICGTCYTIHT